MTNKQVGISSGNHHLQQHQFTPNTQISSIVDDFFRRWSSDTLYAFEVEYINFKDEFYKMQVRRGCFKCSKRFVLKASVCGRHYSLRAQNVPKN